MGCLQIAPDIASAIKLLREGAALEARCMLTHFVVAFPDHAPAHHWAGVAHYLLGELTAAVDAFQRAITLKNDYAEAHSNLGIALNDLGRHIEAIAAYRRAIALKPDFADACNNLGVALNELGEYTEAADACGRALALKPDYSAAHYNLGIALNGAGRHGEAVSAFRQCLVLAPNHAQAHYNLGLALNQLNRLEEAIEAYDAALAVNHNYIEARWNRGLARLASGQFHVGWRDYELRWQLPGKHRLREIDLPRWTGQEGVEGKRVLIQCEQGFGDAIQMLRYVGLMQGRGADCTIEAPLSLRRLISRSFPRTRAGGEVGAGEMRQMDYRIPIMSMPLAFGTFADADIPCMVPYLKADEIRAASWCKVLSGRPLVGLAWRGSSEHGNDKNRSMMLAELLPLIQAHPSISFVALQKGLTDAEHAILDGLENVRALDTELTDFDETAAVMCNLDVMISVDSAPAHLSGAMGKRTWILLPFSADWRWQTDRNDSPWYPTAMLFRQNSIGAWSGVVDRLSSALTDLSDGVGWGGAKRWI